jgi:parallel beta-helix repeat protein
MRLRIRGRGLPPLSLALLAVLLLMPAVAQATTYRYASSSNRIYVENGGTTTLTAIRANTPSLPTSALTRSGNVWTLSAQLYIEDGATLLLYGSTIGGDVDELRLKSNSGSAFIYISAEYGTIDIDTTKVRSWNTSTGTVDSDYSDGRAYIRVRSFLDGDGVTARESRMDIKNSEISYLGYNAAESYGLVWKVIGEPGSNFELYDKVDVFGDILNSHIHHNYYGMYTFGLLGGQWIGNELDHNAGYGFDPHDDSDSLLIQDNDVHDNGFHGIIASKRCDHVVIRNNRSYNNKQAGIMLHRSSDDGLVEGNQAYDNVDSGIALFASWRTIVRNNTLLRNGRSGIRLSMGAGDSRVEGNTIDGGGDGFEFYQGTDTPEPGDNARPKRNLFLNNKVSNVRGNAIAMADSDTNTFQGNTFSGLANLTLAFESSTKIKLNKNTFPAGIVADLQGDSSRGSDMDVYNTSTLKVLLDDYSTARFRDNSRKIFDPDEAVYTTASTTSSVLTLTKANTAGSSTVVTRQLFATPASGTIKVNPTAWGSTTGTKSWNVQSPSSTVSVSYTVGNLAPGAAYDVRRGGTLVATLTASAGGTIAFMNAPGSTSTVGYTVVPH